MIKREIIKREKRTLLRRRMGSTDDTSEMIPKTFFPPHIRLTNSWKRKEIHGHMRHTKADDQHANCKLSFDAHRQMGFVFLFRIYRGDHNSNKHRENRYKINNIFLLLCGCSLSLSSTNELKCIQTSGCKRVEQSVNCISSAISKTLW